MLSARRVFVSVVTLLGLLLNAGGLQAQTSFSTVVVFGDSLSDTGNVAHLVQSATGGLVRYPSDNPTLGFNYTDGRFTDGNDTQPAAQAYFGVWIEQLAASLPGKPAVKDSQDGGTNFAYGDATTASGYTTISEGPVSISLHNMGQQLADYMGTNPTPGPGTLYVLWGGADDIYGAVSLAAQNNQDPTAAATAAAQTAVQNEVSYIQQLAASGATYFMVPNLPPLGAVPSASGTPEATALNTAVAVFQQGLAQALQSLETSLTAQGHTITVYQPDIFTLFQQVAAAPMSVGLGNLTTDAQGISGDPDTYLIWDGKHPTTAGHHYVAAAAAQLLTPLQGSVTALSGPGTVLAGQNAAVAVTVTPAPVNGQASASSASLQGSVTIFNGSTVVGAGPVDSTGKGTIQVNNLAAASAPYTLSAVFAGNTAYNPSTSAPGTLTVIGSSVSTTTTLSAIIGTPASQEQVQLRAQVVPATANDGTPSGTVTFFQGTTSLGSVPLDSTGQASLTTSTLALGSYTFTATYAASGVFAGSTSAAVTENLVAPGFTASANPSSLTIKDGGTGATTLTVQDQGGFAANITPTCGSLPAHLSCTITLLTTPGGTPAGSGINWTLTISTTSSNSALQPAARPGAWSAPEVYSAALLFPGLAGALFFGFRRRLGAARALRLTAVLLMLTAAAAGISGCSNPDVAKGTYQVPVTFTPDAGSGVAAQTINLSVTVD